MYVRSPGEVRVRNIRDHHPLEERLAKFPGPLKGKSKKKETLAWLSSGIDELERLLPNLAFQTNLSHDDKRAVERILLWKILRVFVEFDGTLEGSPAVNEAVRSILAPTARAVDTSSPVYATGAGISGLSESAPTRMQSDSTVDSSAIEHIRNLLLVGESEKAAWAAADRRLWGQALLISGAVSRDLYKQVAREFVRKEINYPGHNNESMAMLYQVLAGNHDECVDELVPVHARAGLQLVSTSATGGPHRDALAGLDQWRETLCLILNTRSPDDALGLKALGNLLTSYGRAEAGHICFLFARHHSVFGGIDDPSADFVLLGSDHRRQPDQFGKEIEALLLSEVYEYGLTLSGNSSHSMSGSPHLSAYKLQHAVTLAEYGYRDKALQYCEAISTAITAQTKRSPYHHYKLEQAVEDLLARLKQAPTEQSTSWLPKPSMNKVSDTMWNRFNKFVAGEENDGSGAGSPAEGPESGPFARIAGGTPTISRPPSVSNFETYGAPPGMPPYAGGPTNHGSPAGQVSRAASRYAPTSAQPATTANRYEPGAAYAPPVRQDTMNSTSSYDYSSQQSGGRQGYGASPAVNYGYQPQDYGVSREESYMSSLQLDSMSSSQSQPTYGQQHPVENGQNGTLQQPSGYGPYDAAPPANQTATTSAAAKQEPEEPAHMPSYGYEPPSTSLEPSSNSQEPQTQTSEEERQATSGYEPPSYQPYSYEPPSYQPDPEPAADGDDENSEPKLKKKSFMDEDDDDDIPALKPKDPKEKTKEEKDRENEEMFRRIAEEDGMCLCDFLCCNLTTQQGS